MRSYFEVVTLPGRSEALYEVPPSRVPVYSLLFKLGILSAELLTLSFYDIGKDSIRTVTGILR